ncbi:M13 family metallopeptidase [Parabacteroides distasonis]|uniref:M13 family metallopeptidase n=1 Tax=Parabacteroides distasonis TaxID=823 RepID=UPI00189D4BFD|nr:M13 family metallopeptidase [Parabacteroides distasonis]MDB9153929.1 M13 family metallopeptidase [Parabacteroides distasonis]MDB9158540.1 M13 family metallopeptidase [Parabacteroides distasonis]MDB9167291.1 M13 family metallopeptidase [Parabacteroides distasonis]MDB9171827.1 M13 family metallopeptidase [Parabacteroides distasonis]
MRKRKMFPFLAAGIVALASCNTPQKEVVKIAAINPANMDTTVAAGTDFYEYACGGWIKNNPLKPEYARFGTFDQLLENNQEQLRVLIEELSVTPHEAGSVAGKIGALYAMGLDSTKLNADGVAPIKEELAAINALATKSDVSKMVATLHKEGMAPFFALFVDADEKNSAMNIVQLYQAGIGMGDRDYYLLEDEGSAKMRDAYRAYINKLFTLAGSSPEQADAAVDAVMKIEKAIAEISYGREDLRDSQKNYNKLAYEDFKQIESPLDWDVYFESMGLAGLKELDAKQINFYKDMSKALRNTTVDEQKYYLAFNLLSAAAPYLSDDFVDADFEFYGKVMSGKQEQQPRWKRSLNTVNGALGEAVGEMYVEKYFPASSKEKMLTLVGNLQTALSERIDGLEWMSDTTKAKAQEKLAAFTVKIGYPDKWRDYSGLEIKDDSYWANVRRSNIFDMAYQLADVDKPVDKSRWHMNPQTVNAYYNPTTNEICFPAAILQPPFFNPDADDAVNYGAIGVVIGHEMTHGFDDQGRNYDKDGNLIDWWTAEDAVRFTERADKLVDQYDQIIVIDTLHANGRFTLGENIADHGGLLVAHQAYLNSLKGKETPAPIDGFTNEQRFFLGYATLWGQNIRPEEIRRRTKIDPHSLGKWRVNAALRNIAPFYAAFDIKEGDPMFMAPADRVVIW